MSAVVEAGEPSARYFDNVQPALVKHFELVASARGGVARLREFILALAVRGKLVPHDPNDEPASELLARIAMAKSTRTGVRRGRRDTVLAGSPSESDASTIPSGWHWARLEDLVLSSEAGWSPSCHSSPRRPGRWGVLKVSAVSWGEFAPEENKELPEDLAPRPECEVKSGDFLLSRANTEQLVARSVLVGNVEPHLMLSDKIIRLDVSTEMNRRFVCMWNNATDARRYYAARATGTSSSMKNVSREVVLGLPVAVPPIREQARIVARFDELMRLCDALEQKGRLEADQHRQMLNVLLNTLTNSASLEELAVNWERVAANFDLLLDRPEAVDSIEKTILDWAVRRPSMRQRFTLPWRLAKLVEVCELVTDGEHATPPRCNDPSQVPLVTAKNVRSEAMNFAHTDFVTREVAERCWRRCKPRRGDILMVSVGATLGRLAIVEDEIDMVLVRSVTLIRPDKDVIDSSYLALHLMSPTTQAEIWASVKQSAQPCLYLGRSAALSIALPSVDEQRRIVARVERLRWLCTEIREKLAVARDVEARVAEALTGAEATNA